MATVSTYQKTVLHYATVNDVAAFETVISHTAPMGSYVEVLRRVRPQTANPLASGAYVEEIIRVGGALTTLGTHNLAPSGMYAINTPVVIAPGETYRLRSTDNNSKVGGGAWDVVITESGSTI